MPDNPLACDYCGIPLSRMIPGGTQLCPCGAHCVVADDRLISCVRAIPGAATKSPTSARRMPGKPRNALSSKPLTPELEQRCRDLASRGAKIQDIADMLSVPRYRVQRACAGTIPLGRKSSSEAVTRREVEHELASNSSSDNAQISVVDPDGPPQLLARAIMRRIAAYWRSNYAKSVASGKMPLKTALGYVGAQFDVSHATVIEAVRRECRELALGGFGAGTIASALGQGPKAVARALAAYPDAASLDGPIVPIEPTV